MDVDEVKIGDGIVGHCFIKEEPQDEKVFDLENDHILCDTKPNITYGPPGCMGTVATADEKCASSQDSDQYPIPPSDADHSSSGKLQGVSADVCKVKEEPYSDGYRENEVKSSWFQCETCSLLFCTKDELSNHSQQHKGIACKICHKICPNKGKLRIHERVHTSEKTFECDVCLQKFKHKHSLDYHRKKHTGELPYQCKTCLKYFNRESELSRHERVHTGEKPHQCEICLKYFSQSSALNLHKRVHTGDKPFECDTCSYKCATKQHLVNHQRKHTGDKPYECEICLKSFSQSSSLNAHRKTVHAGEKPYECDVCSHKCARKQQLIRHQQKHMRKKISM